MAVAWMAPAPSEAMPASAIGPKAVVRSTAPTAPAADADSPVMVAMI
jgi:hypothetical protein